MPAPRPEDTLISSRHAPDSRRRAPTTRSRAIHALRAALPFVAAAATISALALPPLLDRALPKILPDVTVEKKILGFISARRTEADPRIPTSRRVILTFAWLATVAGGVALGIRGARRAPAPAETPAGPTAVADPATRVDTPVIATSSAERYVLEAELGRGGMGVVHVAHDTVLGRRVAVKDLVIPPGAMNDFVARFRQEGRALARLTHPNIVQVYDLIESGERFRMVMELADGGNLSEGIARHGPLAPADAAHVFADIARGLAFAHDQGVIHRDIKPANILFSKDGVPKIADFGLAKLADDGGTTITGSVLGSPAYLSPEQASGGAVDARSDVYSLGVTLFEAVTGTRPFEGAVVSLLARHVNDAPPRLETRSNDVPAELADLVASMMAKDPSARPDLQTVIRVLTEITPAREAPALT